MPSQPPLPPLLTSYLSSQPESSLTLISSILGATSNWLVLRYLYSALSNSNNSNAALSFDESHNGAKKKVVLVSFLRGWEFWRAEAKRLVSLRNIFFNYLITIALAVCYVLRIQHFIFFISIKPTPTSFYTWINFNILTRAWILHDCQTRNNLLSWTDCPSYFALHKQQMLPVRLPSVQVFLHAQHFHFGVRQVQCLEEHPFPLYQPPQTTMWHETLPS